VSTGTDVREWAREEGIEIGIKGPIPKDVKAQYAAAHEGDLPGDDDGTYPAALDLGPDYDTGVTEADFPPDDDTGESTGTASAGGRETRPRRVRPTPKGKAKTFRQRVWGGSKAAKPKTKHPRTSLKGFAEDMFLDLAWTFQGLPPIEKVLYLQAPLVGQIVEDTVKGTGLDLVLQPLARVDRQFKALEALTAPAWVAAIMIRGRRDDDGNYSPETKMMFGGLRHALLAMTRVTDIRFDELRAKAEDLKTASGEIDAIIAYLFAMPEAPGEAEPDAAVPAEASA
jgi:hypothetical protein